VTPQIVYICNLQICILYRAVVHNYTFAIYGLHRLQNYTFTLQNYTYTLTTAIWQVTKLQNLLNNKLVHFAVANAFFDNFFLMQTIRINTKFILTVSIKKKIKNKVSEYRTIANAR
jgi:hypothetical protein